MIKSRLSDLEWEEISAFAVSGQLDRLRVYLNSVLYERSRGDDVCARPFSIRENKTLEPPCFALGYIEKLESFVEETYKREPKKLLENTKTYYEKLKEEINSFFEKPGKTFSIREQRKDGYT